MTARTTPARAGARRAALLGLVGLLGAVLLGLGGTAPTYAADAAGDDAPTFTPDGGPYFGPVLDWTNDSARQYTSRLGVTPSVFGQSVRYPFDEDDETYLQQFVEQSAQQGALDLLTLEPTVPLTELTEDDATALADQLVELHEEYDSRFYVRFAPEMNGSWTPWGQQPEAYVAAFRTVAAAVHAATPDAVMVWSPSYGAGYPFGEAFGAVDGAGAGPVAQLDTNGDGTVDALDDPYAPYYPGDDAVDWVGLSMYYYGEAGTFGENDVPQPGDYAARLAETAGYGEGAPVPFYDTYAAAKDQPMLVETAAVYNPAADGGSQLDIESTWLDQVLDPRVQAEHPLISMIAWLEKERPEAEVDGDTVDWTLSTDGDVADAARATLRRSDVTTGSVTRVLDQETANTATAQVRELESDRGDQMGWIVGIAVTIGVLFLLTGLVGRYLPSWRYPREDDPRDERLDLLRGWIIVAVVMTHVEVAGPYSYVTLNIIGAITGAELFVLLSGLVLGMVYPLSVRRLGTWLAAKGAFKRARKQYLTALFVVLSVYLLGKVPGIDATVITTFTDRGTGEGGAAAQGQVYDLYANAPRLLDYPLPWYALRDLLLLNMGPWVFNIMGLFVVLSLTVPALMWLVQKGGWWVLLAVSWGLYVLQALHPVTLFSSQFEAVFPLLTWQVLFTHGLVVGYYRRQITRALTTRIGKVATAAAVVAYTGGLGLLWLSHTYGFGLPGVPGDLYDSLYLDLYQRVEMQPGRLLDMALVIVFAYALLTTCWKPINAAFGWLYTPLGRVSLYVFIVHVYFVLLVGNIPGLDRTSVWQGTLVHTLVLAAIWFMVRKRFLFKVIPQ